MTEREETDSPNRVVLELTPGQAGSLVVGLNFALQDAHSRPDRWPWVVVAELEAIKERLNR